MHKAGRTTADPMENMVHAALEKSGLRYVAGDRYTPHALDFWLPEMDVHIEVKRFHSPRISEQMSRAENVIAVQGRQSVELVCELLIAMGAPPSPRRPITMPRARVAEEGRERVARGPSGEGTMTRIAAAALAAIIFAGAAPPKQRTPVDAAWEELAAQLHAMQVRRTLDERDIYSTEPGPLFVPYDFHLMRTGKRQERLPVGDPMRELLR